MQYSLIELIIALTVMSSAMVATSLVSLDLPRALAQGDKEYEALQRATTLLITMQRRAMYHFSSIQPLASTTEDGYTTSLSIQTSPDEITKELLAVVSWIDPNHNVHTVSETALIEDL